MLTIREQERKRLAEDIHDTLAQTLAGLSYKIQFCVELANSFPERVASELESLKNTTDGAVNQCRDLIFGLRPDLIDTLGLVPALHKLFLTYTGATGIKVVATYPDNIKSPPYVSISIYRITQEALTNIYKHADVKNAKVTLSEQDGNIILVVSDNGKGFEFFPRPPWVTNPNKLGLLYTRERIRVDWGKFDNETGINLGCTIEARIPLEGGSLGPDKSNDRR